MYPSVPMDVVVAAAIDNTSPLISVLVTTPRSLMLFTSQLLIVINQQLAKVVNEVYHGYNRHQYPFVTMDIAMDRGGCS